MEGKEKRVEKRRETGFGVVVGKEWIPIETVKAKRIYAILIEKRMKMRHYEEEADSKREGLLVENDTRADIDKEQGEQVAERQERGTRGEHVPDVQGGRGRQRAL